MSSVRVFRYGLLRPTAEADRVREQMRLAHAYRNTLVHIERGRRAAVRSAMSAYSDLAALEADLRAAEEARRVASLAASAERSAGRTRSVSEAVKVALADAKTNKRAASEALFARRAAVREDAVLAAEVKRINEMANELQKNARAYCGTYWGSYIPVEEDMQAARKAPLYDGAEPNDPHFVRWNGEGRIGVQLQGGLDAEDVWGASRVLRIDPVDDKAWHRGAGSRLAKRTVLHLRVGSEEGRAPLWARFPMVMHRPLPKGSRLKKATVHLHKVGPREEWSVSLTVELSEALVARPAGNGAVAIDLGWRQRPEGALRVAYWVGDDGQHGELALSGWDVSGLTKADSLRSIRDRNFNTARSTLTRDLGLLPDPLPVWLQKATQTLAQWRSPARLAALARRWREARFPRDDEAYRALEAWRYQDYHLWTWEANQRRGALLHRREVYRCFAAKLARIYQDAVLEEFDLRDMAVRDPDADKADNETARSARHLAAVSEFRGAIEQAFVGHHHKAETPFSTLECHPCSHVNAFDAATSIEQTCASCGATWDQDENAARVLLARWKRERSGGDENTGGARDPETKASAGSRWSRVRALSHKKQERRKGACHVDANVSES